MAEKKGALDGMDISKLRRQAAGSFGSASENNSANQIRTNPANNNVNSEIFQWDDDASKIEEKQETSIPEIGKLRENKVDAVQQPELHAIGNPNTQPEKRMPTAEELGGGIIIENKPQKPDGSTVGPMAEGSEIQQHVKEAERNLDAMAEVAKKRMALEGSQGRKPKNTVIEILMDKTGMRSVEFTSEERKKMALSKKIKVVQVDEHKLKTVKMNRPKAIRQKTIIEKAFSRQFAPFVAAASGYVGKMRNLSSVEIINLLTIDERESESAEQLAQKASLIWSKMVECSIGNFTSFDEFAKNTAEIDIPVFLYAIIRATYPDKETLLMNCANPECTRKVKDENGKIVSRPNQFNHEYSNTDILLVDRISDKLKDEAERIYQNSFTVEDAKKAREDSIINKTFRFALGEDEDILVDVYCPSIYEAIENFERKIESSEYIDDEVYSGLITTARYIRSINLKDEDTGEYDMFDDAMAILDILARMPQEVLEVVQQCIADNIFEYMYRYGFKASSVVCPICGHAFTQDVVMNIERLLFLEAQRHLTSE